MKKKKPDRVSPSYQQAKRIGIVFSFENESFHEEVLNLVERIMNDGKSVETLTFIPKKQKNEEYDRPFFTDQDFSTKGKWKSENVMSFKATDFDYLISADLEINKFIRNILASSKAKCRVGHHAEEDEAYFELMINYSGRNTKEYLNQVYHYLTQMKNG
nr:hypothetical protein [Reichenbachiella versicolor]